MKILKSLFLLPFLFFLAVTNSAGYYYGGLDDYVGGVPSQEDKPSFTESGREVLYSGVFAGLDQENGVLLIDIQVPGFLGPEKVMVPVDIGEDATVYVCHTDTGGCELAGTKGLETVSSLSPEDLKDARVRIMGYTEDHSRIINIETARPI